MSTTGTDAPAAPSGPWAADLASAFPDESQRTLVDAFLRQQVQPHVTRIEQELATSRDATALVNDLRATPADTYALLASEMFGTDAATAVRAALTDVYGTQVPTPDPAPPAPADAAVPTAPPATLELPAEVQEMLSERKAAREQEAYDAQVSQLKATDTTLLPEEFHPFVVSAQGDMQQAYAAYKNWQGIVAARFTPEGELSPPPPNGLGSDLGGGTPPPVVQKHGSIGAAIDDFFHERSAGPPAPVGSV